MVTGVTNRWRRFWLGQASSDRLRRLASRLAAWGTKPYKNRVALAWAHPNGYIAASADLSQADLRLGKHVFIGERVVVYRQGNGGPLILGDGVELHQDCIIEALNGGS